MKQSLFSTLFFLLYLTNIAQEKIPKAGAVQSKASKPLVIDNGLVNNNEIAYSKGTIFMSGEANAEKAASTRTSGICSIFLFESVSEAQTFAVNFKNSDSNISDFTYTGIKGNLYYFNFSTIEPRDTKWYLQLFKNNGLSLISYNGKIQSIDQALSK